MAYQLFPLLGSSRWPYQHHRDPFDFGMFSDFGNHWRPMTSDFGDHWRQVASPSSSTACQKCAKDEQKRSGKWEEVVRVPGAFSPDDVEVQEDGDYIVVRAQKEDDLGGTGMHRSEMVHRIRVPDNIKKDSLKSVWMNNSHSLVLTGEKMPDPKQAIEGVTEPKAVEQAQPADDSQNEVAKKPEDTSVTPLAFYVDPFGFTRYFVPADRKPQESNTRSLPIQKDDQLAKASSSEIHSSGGEVAKPFKIAINVTGYDKDDIKVEHSKGRMKITGEHKTDMEEYSFLKFFTLPDHVDADNAQWDMEKGKLVITVPVRPKA
jgi:HSP20 family molecular chaperone IbpA